MPKTHAAVDIVRGLLQDDGLRDQFLPPLTEFEAQTVERLLPAVWESAQKWLARFPSLNADTLLPLSIFRILQMPRLPVADIATAVEWELWNLAMDDLFDEGAIEFGQLRSIAEECRTIAVIRPGGESASTPFAEALIAIKNSLAQHPSFVDLQPTFAVGLVRLLDGFFYTHQVRASGRVAAPHTTNIDQYLYYGSWTLQHPFLWSLPLYDDDSILPGLGSLTQIAEQCSRVLRLANDLATWPREQCEGTLNAVSIEAAQLAQLGRSGAHCHEAALRRVRGRLADERLALRALEDTVRTKSGVERGFLRLTEMGSGMYERQDLRNWAHLLTFGSPPDAACD